MADIADIPSMELSVIIPTHNRLDRLEACLLGLVRQEIDPRTVEVLVGIDGPSTGESELFQDVVAGRYAGSAMRFEHGGPAATRNRLIARARGRTLLLLNDDVIPEPGLLAAHMQAQLASKRPAMVLGSAPWVVHPDDRLFDRLIRESSMVFFYDQMDDDQPGRDWGYRHAWTLNLSVPADSVRAVGGFCEHMLRPVYEDLELGWRLQEQFDMPVLYRPAARVLHDHRYEPLAFLQRDIVLGHQAWRLAEVAPECARDMFGVDVRSGVELTYAREFLARHEKSAHRHLPMFLKLADIPADALRGEHGDFLLRVTYEQTLLVRKYMWRLGQIAASEGRCVENAAAWLEAEPVYGAGQAN